MNKQQLLLLAAIILFLLGAFMIYLGIQASILPPGITGVGFVVIGWVFLQLRK